MTELCRPWARTRLVTMALVMLSADAALAQRSLGDLTGPWQLFVDDHLLESRTNVNRTYHPFEKHVGNPVLTPTKPWEAKVVYIYGTVLPAEDGSGYRMWYHTMRPEDTADDGSNILYATSPDGITWDKPNLFINSWHGSAANNMIFDRATISGITSVIHTPFDPSPARQYKLFNYEPGSYYGAWSADGIYTVDVPNNPIITGVGDVAMASWDPHTQQYLAYVKVNTDVNGMRRRSVALCTSQDFLTWTAPQLVLEPDTFDDRWAPPGTQQRTHFYGLCAFAYESMYIGILWIFRATEPEGYTIGPVYAEIISSRDGVHWKRQEGDRIPMLPLGPPGAWDDGQLYTAIAPLYIDGKLAIYYGACDDVHGTATRRLNCSIGLATLRKDGFASLTAGSTVGSVTTRVLPDVSGQLHVNYRSQAGELRVEVLDADANVIPGYSQAECLPLGGDSIDEVVGWATRSELPDDAGPLRLRFVLRNTSLFSFKTAAPAYDPPAITRHPSDRVVFAGDTAGFSVQAVGLPPLSYQWRKNGVDLQDSERVSGASTPTLALGPVDADDLGAYTCVVISPYGTARSNAASLGLSSAQFIPLGAGTSVTGITADGSVVCGTSGGNRAFIWTAEHGLRDLGVPSGASESRAAGVGIHNHNVVVAVNTNAGTSRARRWEGSPSGVGTFAGLPRLNGTLEWTATGLGSDGGEYWISGFSTSGGDGNGRRAARYTRGADATVSFPLPASGHDHSDFHAVADNGWCGGQYQYKGTAPTGGARNAMIYMGGTQCVGLHTLLGAPTTSYEAVVKAMSRDGSTRGGWSYYPGGGAFQRPAIWKSSVTPMAIPFIPGGDGDNSGEILALDAEGHLAGGYSYRRAATDGPREALIWDAVNGTRRYQSVLTDQYGLDLEGWSLQEIRAISASGEAIAGNGVRQGVSQGWLVLQVTPSKPTLDTSPDSQRVCPGGSAVFQIDPVPDALAYRWLKDGAALDEDAHHAGVATPVLVLSHVDAAFAGEFQCVVTNAGGGSVSDSATLSLKPTGPADLDNDCDVDLDDFALFLNCSTGPGHTGPPPAGCLPAQFTAADQDGDGDVDQEDFASFQRCYSSADQEIDAACAW